MLDGVLPKTRSTSSRKLPETRFGHLDQIPDEQDPLLPILIKKIENTHVEPQG